ncbi:MAG: helix-hairpin-helix domain-containing protein [Candidatus Helarchaeota archaeon]
MYNKLLIKPKPEKPKPDKLTPTENLLPDTSTEPQPSKDAKLHKFQLSDIKGLGLAKIKLLNANEIHTIEDLLNCNPEELAKKISGIGVKSFEKWIQNAKELISN